MSCSEPSYYKKQNTILILFWIELGQAENFLISPHIAPEQENQNVWIHLFQRYLWLRSKQWITEVTYKG